MQYFVVDSCTTKGCLFNREGIRCVKDSMRISHQLTYFGANLHDAAICEVRRQIDIYRLTNMLEDNDE